MAGLALLLALGGSVPAHADGFDGQRYRPAAGGAGGFVVERPVVLPHLQWGVGLFLHYADNPILQTDRATGDILSRPLDQSLTTDFLLSLGLGDIFELALHVPLELVYSGDSMTVGSETFQAAGGFGDIRLVPKFAFMDRSHAFVLGVAVPVTLPTGDDQALRGAGGTTVEPRLLVGWLGRSTSWVANIGYRWDGGNPPSTLPVGDELTFGLAMTHGVTRRDLVDLQVEVIGGWHLGDEAPKLTELPLEAVVGAIIKPDNNWRVYLGGSIGVTDGLGTPDFRVIAGVRFSPAPTDVYRDSDGDGISDRDDRCPHRAEDFDGFRDEDGCPERDNDRDGVPDDRDECPDIPERRGDDGDGCPDKGKVIIRGNRIIIIGKIQFETGSARLRPQSRQLLDEIAFRLKKHRRIRKVRVDGHTDNIGGSGLNKKLSTARAQSVRRGLIRRGIAPKRLTARGWGESRPRAPNRTKAGRARNRRVQFVVLR